MGKQFDITIRTSPLEKNQGVPASPELVPGHPGITLQENGLYRCPNCKASAKGLEIFNEIECNSSLGKKSEPAAEEFEEPGRFYGGDDPPFPRVGDLWFRDKFNPPYVFIESRTGAREWIDVETKMPYEGQMTFPGDGYSSRCMMVSAMTTLLNLEGEFGKFMQGDATSSVENALKEYIIDSHMIQVSAIQLETREKRPAAGVETYATLIVEATCKVLPHPYL